MNSHEKTQNGTGGQNKKKHLTPSEHALQANPSLHTQNSTNNSNWKSMHQDSQSEGYYYRRKPMGRSTPSHTTHLRSVQPSEITTFTTWSFWQSYDPWTIGDHFLQGLLTR